jgi:hypothetical protein
MTGTVANPVATLAPCNTGGVGPTAAALAGSFVSSATPSSLGSTGTRFFWSNTLGTIYSLTTAMPAGGTGTAPPTTGAPIQ